MKSAEDLRRHSSNRKYFTHSFLENSFTLMYYNNRISWSTPTSLPGTHSNNLYK